MQNSSNQKRVFLSHKHQEKHLVGNTIEFFSSLGADVYVDWMDKNMPPTTNKETAIKIKQQIKSANRFLVLATELATNANWVSWELGIADGIKNPSEIALLPICKDAGNWPDREYFGAYNYISKSTQGNWCVWTHDGKFDSYLKDWLKK